MEEDGFKLVKNRKRNNQSFLRWREFERRNIADSLISTINNTIKIGTLNIDSQVKLKHQLEKCIEELKLNYLETWKLGLKGILGNDNEYTDHFKFQEVICFGLGNFSKSASALYQFALLYYLKDIKYLQAYSFVIYDPLFTEFEKNHLELFDFKLMNKNIDCSYRIPEISSEPKYFFYMPHMYHKHYYNLLTCNSNCLEKMLLFGNSLTSYLDQTNLYEKDNSHNLKNFLLSNEQYSFVEHKIDSNQFCFTDVFSQQSFHKFLPRSFEK